ncbi:hypothetical protein [Jeotgalibacillus proteolyticus]|uniref:Uncharacterized protein n=1 Tax=Jeotgalibacillus proteolyticus TaxID=2082395 RepID=A0A2S5GE21_9BACL|nr:hypothetical protein [Jeotgalibacillus proteolyticus]PPA71292.1 hypothetical protein C4B60_04295 [Jeotgalibacillus proteolyticus]
MSGSKWNDQEIKDLLKKMPKMKSGQSAEDLYAQIQREEQKKAAKKPPIWVPVGAGLASVGLLILLLPPLLPDQESMNSSAGNEQAAYDSGSHDTDEFSSSSTESSDDRRENEMEFADKEKHEADKDSAEIFSSEEAAPEEETSDNFTASDQGQESDENQEEMESQAPLEESGETELLFASELNGKAYLSTALVTPDSHIIPMTFVLPVDFSGQTPWELYNRWAGQIDEEGLGFIEFHPISTQVENAGGNVLTANIDQPENYLEEEPTSVFEDVMNATFGNDGRVQLQLLPDEDNNSVQANEPFELDNSKKGYYIFEQSTGDYYMVQSVRSFDTVEEAIYSMQFELPDDQYENAISEQLELTVNKAGDQLEITLENSLDDQAEQEKLQFVEAVLLTAASFDFEEVIFSNVSKEPVSGIDLTLPVEVPVGMNTHYLAEN